MKQIIYFLLFVLPVNLLAQEKIVDFIVKDLKKIHFYYYNKAEERFYTIQSLKKWLEAKNRKLLFATNGGMFTP